jgi:hypothetical protein
MSRDTGVILASQDLGKPQVQKMTAADFKTAFDIMLIPWKNTSSSIPTSSTTWQLSVFIWSQLENNLAAAHSSEAWDYLRNLFASPLYIFNPVMLGATPDTNVTEPDLPRENYINGSYAKTRTHAVPARWTVITYVAVSGSILILIFMVLGLSISYDGPEPSALPLVDVLKLDWILLNDRNREVRQMRDIFGAIDLENDSTILDEAANIAVRLRGEVVSDVV